MEWTDPVYLASLIRTLDDTRFAALANALLVATAAQHGIPNSCIATNLHTNEPDGGIDAQCTNAPLSVPRIIPRAFVDYQFKSGTNQKSVPKIVDEDVINKPRVSKGLRNGHAFVYLAAWDRGSATDEKLGSELNAKGFSVDIGQVVFMGVDSIARLLQSFPQLIEQFLRIDVDESVTSQLGSLRAQIGDRVNTRVVGAAGDGKTRLVLEALRTSSFEDTVLYAKQVADVPNSFIAPLGELRTSNAPWS